MSIHRTIIQSNFDSVLDPAAGASAALLTIALKVTLVPLDPTAGASPPVRMSPGPAHLAHDFASIRRGAVVDANGTLVRCRSWMDAEWNNFKIRFKWMVESSWKDQIILLPRDDVDPRDVLTDEDYRQFIANPKVQAHAEGALRIGLLPVGVAGHVIIEVVKLDDRSSNFRERSLRISDQSVFFKRNYDPRWPDTFFGQASAAHEIGHWLHDLTTPVFAHEDADYAKALTPMPGETAAQFKTRQDREQYGHVLGKREALMGAGNVVTEYDAGPWTVRIRRHTRKLGWRYIHRINFDAIKYDPTPRQKQLAANVTPH
jgi:hypothetical protein